MGLFDKKQCSICGKESGLLGNTKLADGNLCKDCSRKLSPFFHGRKKATVSDIQKQLAYRLENEQALSSFTPTQVAGFDQKVFVDEEKKKFVVNNSSDFRKGNPDIIDLSQVKAVEIEIDEDKDEIYKDEEKKVSFDPPRYEYAYEFEVNIAVDSPYFDSISIDLKDGDAPKTKVSAKYKALENTGKKIQAMLMPNLYHYDEAELQTTTSTDEEVWKCPKCGVENTGKFCSECGTSKEETTKWFCPECGQENTGKFCVKCGTKKPENI